MAKKEKYHPRTVVNFPGNFAQLAAEICNMSYDQVAELINHMATKIEQEANDDLIIRKRKKLSESLFETSVYLKLAKGKFDEAWKICEPRM